MIFRTHEMSTTYVRRALYRNRDNYTFPLKCYTNLSVKTV